eukprot:762708-Hanusia_phi.AAC.6
MDFTVGTALNQTAGIDAYVRARVGGGAWLKTRVHKSRDPVFNAAFIIPALSPSFCDVLELQLKDYDVADEDDLVGTLHFDLSAVAARKFRTPTWYNIYGAPTSTDSLPSLPGPFGSLRRMADEMNEGRREGSAYRGRVLLSLCVDPQPDPSQALKSSVVNIAPLQHKMHPDISEPIDIQYGCIVDVLEAMNVTANAPVTCEVCCGGYTMTSNAKSAMSSAVEWNERLQGVFAFPRVTTSSNSLPDLFVNVMCKGKRLCYLRLRTQVTRGDAQWLELQDDEFGGFKAQRAGRVLLRLAVTFDELSNLDMKRDKVVISPSRARVKYQLLCKLYASKGLSDNLPSSLLASTFITISCAGVSATSSEKKGKSGVFLEALLLDVVLPVDLRHAPPLLINSWRNFSRHSQLTASLAELNLSELTVEGEARWLPLRPVNHEENLQDPAIFASLHVTRLGQC